MQDVQSTESDHVVRVACWYKWFVNLQTVCAATVFGLLWYDGPETEWPGVSRFTAFTCLFLAITNFYYMASAHLCYAAFNCWAYLILSCFSVLLWTTTWIDITMRVGILYITPDPKFFDNDSEFGQITRYNIRTRAKMAAGAAVSGFLTLLILGCLINYGSRLHDHRVSGRPYVVNGRWRFRRGNDSYTLPRIEPGAGQDPFATPTSNRSRITPSPVQEAIEMSPRSDLGKAPPAYAKDM